MPLKGDLIISSISPCSNKVGVGVGTGVGVGIGVGVGVGTGDGAGGLDGVSG
tara:strand:- start:2560 stop:2715 length:156 start_codon:yes stop_codon:yes gene_type:complete